MSFRWEDIDHSITRLKLLDLSIEMNRLIKADEKRIRFEQRGNLNSNAVPSLVLQMQQNRTEELAQKTYDIYCDTWQKQGNRKSAAFLRAIFARGIRTVLRARAQAIAGELSRFAVATAFPAMLAQAHLRSLDLNMRRMEDRWRRRIEIEAKECEHAERVAKQSHSALTNGQAFKKEALTRTQSGQDPEATQGVSLPSNLTEQSPKKLHKPLMLKYRSGVKRAILVALTKNPVATDADVCRLLDADGSEELPATWRSGNDDRLFFDAYTNPGSRRRVEVTISKIRSDLRDRGLLE